jgi:hypothetical protein
LLGITANEKVLRRRLLASVSGSIPLWESEEVGFSGPNSKPERNGSGDCAMLHADAQKVK